MLSVICPIYNEEKYIDTCIKSILEQDYPKDDLEVIFVDGMSTDRTRDIVNKYASAYPWIILIDNPDKIVPQALNRAIAVSHGNIIMRIDAHASFASNYFSALAAACDKYDADNVGAACRTDVLNKTGKTLAICEVLGHPLGVGNSSFRIGIDRVKEVDTVPFGCWHRRVFDKYGYFDNRLIRNQDIEFSKRIIRNGGKIVIIPDTYSTYFARETYSKLAKNNYSNGKWNILTVWYTHQFNSLSVRHFVPLLFLLSLILPALCSVFYNPLIWISIISLLTYLITVSLVSIRLALKKHLNFCYLVATFFVLHISYGCGSLAGLLKVLFYKR